MPGGAGKSTSKLLPVILTCIPYTLAAVSCWGIAHSSQKRKELYFHTALPAIVGGGAAMGHVRLNQSPKTWAPAAASAPACYIYPCVVW